MLVVMILGLAQLGCWGLRASASDSTLPPGSIPVPTSGTFLYLLKPDAPAGSQELLFRESDSTFFATLGAEEFRAWVTRLDGTHRASVTLDAPLGVALATGNYDNALRSVVRNAVNPGIDGDIDSEGCNELHGDFTVDDMSLAADGQIRVFQATFHYFCDVQPSARHGRIRIENLSLPEAPAPVVGVSVKAEGTVNIKTGAVTVGGTVSCDRAVAMTVHSVMTQVTNKTNVYVEFNRTVNCVALEARWSAFVPEGIFRPGDATLTSTGSWCENSCVRATTERLIQLNSGKN